MVPKGFEKPIFAKTDKLVTAPQRSQTLVFEHTFLQIPASKVSFIVNKNSKISNFKNQFFTMALTQKSVIFEIPEVTLIRYSHLASTYDKYLIVDKNYPWFWYTTVSCTVHTFNTRYTGSTVDLLKNTVCL